MRVMSQRVGILTQAWTRVSAMLSPVVFATLLAACSTQLSGGGPPLAQQPGEATRPPTPQSAKARCVSL